MSRMSISMCENDGVPSVRTIASACAASAARSDQCDVDALHDLVGARLLEGHPALAHRGQALGIVLDAERAQAVVGERQRERQPDAAASDDRDVVAHQRAALRRCASHWRRNPTTKRGL